MHKGILVMAVAWSCLAGATREQVARAQVIATRAAVADETLTTFRLPPVEPISMEGAHQVECEAAADPRGIEMDAVRAEIRKYAWRKGDFIIMPYGSLWFNMAYETQRTNTGDFAFYVFSASDRQGIAMNLDAKATRLGLDLTGPNLACLDGATVGGKVEIDFQGQFVQENKPGVLLRHAYWEAAHEDYRILAGQTWDVISPLVPSTIMYSSYWGAGNIGYRRAQLRGERFFHLSDSFLLTAQGSMNVDLASEFPAPGTTSFSGDHSGWPVIEGRTAVTLGQRGEDGRPVTLGVSGHIGEQSFDFLTPPAARNTLIRTWSFNVDLYAPLSDRLGFQGEFYFGENLGTFLGGILQGVDLGTRRPIGDRGGWFEIWCHVTPRLHSHVGYTIDSPNRNDVTLATERAYNAAYWGNVIYDVTKQFNLGIEISSWRTLYVNRLPGEAVRLEFRLKYDF